MSKVKNNGGDAKKLQPIIVKKIKKAAHGAHGGAWKIAYADFVTAMMAFFLLMWLLGSTTEGDKKGIADFFASPMKVSLMGGSGAGDATSVVKGGGQNLTQAVGQMKSGETPPAKRAAMQVAKAQLRQAEAARLEELRKKVEDVLASDPRLSAIKSQIRLDMTRDGLRIQIVDENNRPMFSTGSAVVQPYMRELLHLIGEVLAEVPNRITLEGHTDATPFANPGLGERGYSNWELSSDRANASRRELLAGALPEDRVLRVQGLAASVPFDKNDPQSPANRRISIIVMNRDAEDRFFHTTPDAAENTAEPPGPQLSTVALPDALAEVREARASAAARATPAQ